MKKKKSLKELLARLKGKNKMDIEDMESVEEEKPISRKEKMLDEMEDTHSHKKGNKYKDDYDDMGTSNIQVRKRTNKHFVIGE